jgi:hypothetical protein
VDHTSGRKIELFSIISSLLLLPLLYHSLEWPHYVNRMNIQLAQIGQANRVANALAIYQMLPRYTPPQTINVNVSDCTRLPALCVH